MKVNKKGQRSIHLHDEDAILYVENLAKDMKCSLYEATEKIIYDRIRSELIVDCSASENCGDFKIKIDRFGSGEFIHVLLENCYTVIIEPLVNDELLITVKRKEG